MKGSRPQNDHAFKLLRSPKIPLQGQEDSMLLLRRPEDFLSFETLAGKHIQTQPLKRLGQRFQIGIYDESETTERFFPDATDLFNIKSFEYRVNADPVPSLTTSSSAAD